MNKLEQAARQLVTNWDSGLTIHDELDALREALAEPDIEEMTLTQIAARREQAEQEPVAWKDLTYGNLHHQDFGNSTPLYAAPVRTKDLTDDEIAKIFSKYASDLYKARAVIAADREKNK